VAAAADELLPGHGKAYAEARGVNQATTVLAIAICSILGGQALLLAALNPQTSAALPAEAAAVKQFDQAIATYMALRNKLRTEVAGPVKDSTASQVNNASDALAGAIQRSRQDARVGTIFAAPVATMIKRRIADTVRDEHLATVLSKIDDDEQASLAPKVHLRLPVSAQMATMPPSLLKVLPVLPKELEYRILGKNLVIRDVDASLILDYIPLAVPRQ
jgi:hypothetical protein